MYKIYNLNIYTIRKMTVIIECGCMKQHLHWAGACGQKVSIKIVFCEKRFEIISMTLVSRLNTTSNCNHTVIV